MATKTKTKSKGKVEETAEDLDLEDLDDDVTEDEGEAKSKKSSSSKIPEITFGVKHLAEHLSKKLDKVVTTRELRAQIRRMVRDESGRVDREITAGNRTRYDWPKGLKDPEVKAIIAAYEAGEPEVAKKKALDELKERGNKKKKAKAKAKAKAKKEQAEVADDDDIDPDEDDD